VSLAVSARPGGGRALGRDDRGPAESDAGRRRRKSYPCDSL